eukprot:COSAG05_NODE_975_length_6350_cov_6.983523_2_plen_95_part_00
METPIVLLRNKLKGKGGVGEIAPAGGSRGADSRVDGFPHGGLVDDAKARGVVPDSARAASVELAICLLPELRKRWRETDTVNVLVCAETIGMQK